MKENKRRDASLPTSLNFTAEIGEILKRGFDLLSLICLYLLRHLFFKKSKKEMRSFFYFFGEDLSFSFGKTLLLFLLISSFLISIVGVGHFFFPLFGSLFLMNVYLIFFRFNFYLRWMAFFVFLTFFVFKALNLNQDREVSFES
jgi:hypothetical protein